MLFMIVSIMMYLKNDEIKFFKLFDYFKNTLWENEMCVREN